ncbi:hypothetical protein GIB67_011352 [Kingdonia uniflora]|uniref:DDE Tnp4 domain-containing protein n=1 Tax=Kingdonia uniflora TaxID=39325 RepID=A0A7J7LCJ3_9MAGN|nr:hypothetical protein GIB67_011352 [Kingdonia uniflora]
MNNFEEESEILVIVLVSSIVLGVTACTKYILDSSMGPYVNKVAERNDYMNSILSNGSKCWEGTAHDQRVLDDARSRMNPFIIPNGKYYLGDAGYTNKLGILAPYLRITLACFVLHNFIMGIDPNDPITVKASNDDQAPAQDTIPIPTASSSQSTTYRGDQNYWVNFRDNFAT